MRQPEIDDQTQEWLAFVERVRTDPSISFDEQWARFLELSETRDPIDRDRCRRGCPRPSGSRRRISVGSWPISDSTPTTSFTGGRSNTAPSSGQTVIDRLGIVFDSPRTEILDLANGPTDPRWLPGARLNITDSCFQPEDCVLAIVQGSRGRRERHLSHLRRARDAGQPGRQRPRRARLRTRRPHRPLHAHDRRVRGRLSRHRPRRLRGHLHRRQLRAAGGRAPARDRRGRRRSSPSDVFSRGGRTIALYDKVCEASAPRAIVINDEEVTSPLLRAGDLLWSDFLGSSEIFESVTAEPDTLTNVLFSSGTTGDPKAIPWTHLTPIKCGMDGRFHQDIGPGSVVCLADQHRLDDGSVADLRHPAQPRLHRALRGSPERPGFCPVCRARRGQHARRGAVAGSRMAGVRRLR